jgi:isopropylmalate/homocitrate/citramalate synthase
MRKLNFVVGLAIGYVLGTRAGRERYEQLAKSARDLSHNPRVKGAARQARQATGAAAGRVADTVGDRLPQAVADRVASMRRKVEDDGWGTDRP